MRDARVEISLRRVADLGALAREVARREGVAEANLRSGSRGWSVSYAWKRVCPVAVPGRASPARRWRDGPRVSGVGQVHFRTNGSCNRGADRADLLARQSDKLHKCPTSRNTRYVPHYPALHVPHYRAPRSSPRFGESSEPGAIDSPMPQHGHPYRLAARGLGSSGWSRETSPFLGLRARMSRWRFRVRLTLERLTRIPRSISSWWIISA